VNRTLEESLAWSAEGTELCRKAIASLDEPAYEAPTLLAGWNRRHLVVHLAANADAIGRLVSWARHRPRDPDVLVARAARGRH
jgi:maleylpyruvate isomerase